jgi:hypothetical protein
MTNPEIATLFSNGEFDKITDFIADNAIWEVVEEDKFSGKIAIIENCYKVGQYYKSVTTKFTTLNVISDNNKVVVNGTAEFIRDGKRISFVSACDIYEFNDSDQIQKITSYCIQEK